MTPTQSFDNFPEFANAGTKTQPNDAKYAQGFLPQDVLPAEWLNYFLAGSTKGITALNTGVASVEAEINTVLASRNVDPDASATNQLLTVLNRIKAEAILAAHPVGSLYWTSSNENPAITFGGGTWTQIKDKFVWAKGDSDTVNATGGAKTVTLEVDNLPSHNHSFTGGSHTHSFTPSGTISVTTNPTFTGSSHSHTYTPQGKIASTSGGTDNKTATESSHTHGYTPSGKIASTSGGTDNKTAGMSENNTGTYHASGLKGSNEVSVSGSISKSTKSGYGIGEQTVSSSLSSGFTIDVAHTHTAYFTGSAGTTTSNSGHSHAAYFTGTQATLTATQGGTISGGAYSFSGTNKLTSYATQSGTIGNTGSGTAVTIMPPYVVKYCWERTA